VLTEREIGRMYEFVSRFFSHLVSNWPVSQLKSFVVVFDHPLASSPIAAANVRTTAVRPAFWATVPPAYRAQCSPPFGSDGGLSRRVLCVGCSVRFHRFDVLGETFNRLLSLVDTPACAHATHEPTLGCDRFGAPGTVGNDLPRSWFLLRSTERLEVLLAIPVRVNVRDICH
jgi:hypothetical protein